MISTNAHTKKPLLPWSMKYTFPCRLASTFNSPNNNLRRSPTWERRVSFIYQAKLKPARCFRWSGFACPTLVSLEPPWCHNTRQGSDFTAPAPASEHTILWSPGKSNDSRALQECLMNSQETSSYGAFRKREMLQWHHQRSLQMKSCQREIWVMVFKSKSIFHNKADI